MRKTEKTSAALSEMERALAMSNYMMNVVEVDDNIFGCADYIINLYRIEKTRFTPVIRLIDKVNTCSFSIEANVIGSMNQDEVKEFLKEYNQAYSVMQRLNRIAAKHGISESENDAVGWAETPFFGKYTEST